METTKLVSQNAKDVCWRSSSSQAIGITFIPPFRDAGNLSSLSQAYIWWLASYQDKNKKKILKMIMNNWRKKTHTQYNTYLKSYAAFCQCHGSYPMTSTETITVDFLTDMFLSSYGHSIINKARAAVSGINSTGSHPLVCWFMEGLFNMRPSIRLCIC